MDWFNLVGQTIKIFVPGIGIAEGVVQTVSGDPYGPIKVFVPTVGVIEGVQGAAGDVWQTLSTGAQDEIKTVAQNSAQAVAPWLLIAGLGLALVIVLKK